MTLPFPSERPGCRAAPARQKPLKQHHRPNSRCSCAAAPSRGLELHDCQVGGQKSRSLLTSPAAQPPSASGSDTVPSLGRPRPCELQTGSPCGCSGLPCTAPLAYGCTATLLGQQGGPEAVRRPGRKDGRQAIQQKYGTCAATTGKGAVLPAREPWEGACLSPPLCQELREATKHSPHPPAPPSSDSTPRTQAKHLSCTDLGRLLIVNRWV